MADLEDIFKYINMHDGQSIMVPVLPEREFHPGLCSGCFAMPSPDKKLHCCGQCQMVYYCSRLCQKKHWSQHKKLCKHIALKEGKNLFHQAKDEVRTPVDWIQFQERLQAKVENQLCRPLSSFERNVLQHPRVCEVCKDSTYSLLFDCRECHSVFYCCDDHRDLDDKNHSQWCLSLFSCLESISHLSNIDCYQVPFLKYSTENYQIFPSDITQFFKQYGEHLYQDMSDCEMRLYSSLYTFPLTVLYAFEAVGAKLNRKGISTVSELKLHVVGAVWHQECAAIPMWEIILHILPQLMRLHITFIGPELSIGVRRDRDVIDTGFTLCSNCANKGRCMKVELCVITYDKFVKTSEYDVPDAVCAFNCGIHEYFGHPEDTWIGSLPEMLKSPDIPLILTSYTKTEALWDVGIIRSVIAAEELLNVRKNPFCSVLPRRDFCKEDGCDVFFVNGYVVCLQSVK